MLPAVLTASLFTQIVESALESEQEFPESAIQLTQREKEVVGFSSSGRPREYQLRLRVSFRITAGSNQEVVPATELVLHRDMTTTDVQLLSKEQEEEILYHDMQSDIARQMLRRLAALRP